MKRLTSQFRDPGKSVWMKEVREIMKNLGPIPKPVEYTWVSIDEYDSFEPEGEIGSYKAKSWVKK